MVSILNFTKSVIPSLIFWLVAAFLLSRMMIGFSPASEFAWQLYFLFAPFGREVAVFVDAIPSWQSFSFIGCFIFFGFAAFLSWSHFEWLRTRALMTHLSLLVTLFALNDEQVFSAAASPGVEVSEAGWWPELTATHPLLIALLAALIGLCLLIHWHIISKNIVGR